MALPLVCASCGKDADASGVERPPEVVPDEFDVLVRARLAAVGDDLLDQPESAALWGELAGVYDAAGAFDRALVCYARAATLAPGDWRWPYFRGQAYQLVDQGRALEEFRRARSLRNDYAPLEIHLGLWTIQAEEFAAAKTHFERALELEPNSLNARLGLVRVALAEGDRDTALRWAEEARALAPDETAVLAHMAQVQRALGNAEEAARQEQLAAAGENRQRTHGLAPFDDPARSEQLVAAGAGWTWRRQRAERMLSEGRAEDALIEWNEAIEFVTEPPEARVGRAEWVRVMTMLERSAEVLPRLERWLAEDEGWAEGWNRLGLLHARDGSRERAEEAWQRALELEPERADVANNLAGLYLQSGRAGEAAELMRVASEHNPEHVPTRFNHALLLRRTNQLEAAWGELDAALAIEPEHAEALYLRGEIALALGRAVPAERALRAAALARPDHAPSQRDLGRALWQLARYEEALETWRAARARFGEAPAILIELAWGLATCPAAEPRDGVRALEIASSLRERNAQDPRVLDVLAAAQAETGDFAAAASSQQAAIEAVERTAAARGAEPATELMGLLRARLALYQAGQPFRDLPE